MPALGNEAELIACVGEQATDQLVLQFGGQRVYVPTKSVSGTAIEAVIGSIALGRLIEDYGGFWIDVPNRRAKALPSRRRQIFEYFEAGRGNRDIANLVGCTERAVRGYRAKWRETFPGGNRELSA